MKPATPKTELSPETHNLRPSNFVTQIFTVICAAVLLAANTASADYTVPARMAWWYDARFGMFIHFGSYSYLGHGEWAFNNEGWSKVNYQTQVSANFNPTNFNANAIVSAAKAAGMKYIVITAKHHEGYAMWHSQVPGFTDVTGTKLYNLYDYSGFHRDVLMELKNECDAQGIKFCLYYSIMDWDHPSQNISTINGTTFTTMTSMAARTNYINDMKAQLSELVTNYQPAVLWFDGDWCGNPNPPTLADWWTQPDATNLYSFLLSLKPDLVINERVKRGLGLGDFECPEQTVPAAALARPWETCATMNGAWGYNSSSENSYRSTAAILREMVQVISRDGNYLLNIGPMGDGTMTPGSTNILGQFAPWMSVYGESVHGTTRSPFGSSEPTWGYYTKRPGKLYAHVLTWPGMQLSIPALSNTITRVYLLNDTNTSLSYAINGAGINITLPASAPNTMDSVVALEMNGVPIPAATSLALRSTGGTALASADNAANGEGAAQAFDGSTATKWFNNNAGTTGWLQYQFGGGAAWAVTQYEIASANDVPSRDPTNWQFQGSTNGVNWVTLDTEANQTFAARYFFNTYNLTNILAFPYYRLNITANNGDGDGLQLSEFSLFAEPPGPQGFTTSWTNGQVNLNWSSLTGANGYTVKRSTNSGSGYAAIAGLGATNYTDTAVTNGTTYYYVVSATNALGESPNSAEVSATPGATTNLLVNPGFEWNTAGDIINTKATTGFDASGNDVAGWLNAGTTYADSGVDFAGNNGTVTHGGNVVAYCDQGDSGAYQVTRYPMIIGDRLTLTWWAKSSGNHAGQNVQLLSAAATSTAYSSLIPLTTSTAALPDTGSGGAYTQYTLTYTATAADAGRYVSVSFASPGAAGSWAMFDDFNLNVALLPTPTGLTAAAGNAEVILNWPAVGRATGYNVKRATTNGGPYTLIATNIPGCTFTDLGVTNGITYYYTVSSINGYGESGNSVPVAATPGDHTAQFALVNPGFETNTAGAVISSKINTGFDTSGNDVAGWLNAGTTYVDSGVDFAGDNGIVTHGGNVVAYCDQGDSGAYQVTRYPMIAGDHLTLTWWAKSSWNNAGQNVGLLSATTTSSAYSSLIPLTNSTAALSETGNAGAYTQYTLNYTATVADAGNYVAVSFASPGSAGSWAMFDDFNLNVGSLPFAPAGLGATAGDTQVKLNWPATSYAAGYNVKRSTVSGGPYSMVAANIGSLSFTNTSLSNGTMYYYVVSGTNGVGEGGNSTEVSARPTSLSVPQINAVASNGMLQINWPSDRTGWTLQAQTNSLNTGLGTNWVDVPGSSATNQMNIPIVTTNGSVFFRLVY